MENSNDFDDYYDEVVALVRIAGFDDEIDRRDALNDWREHLTPEESADLFIQDFS